MLQGQAQTGQGDALPRLTLDQWRAKQREAKMRAKDLLLSLLSDAQILTLRDYGYIPVLSNTKEEWRVLGTGIEGNCLREFSRTTYCAHLRSGKLPRYEVCYPADSYKVTPEKYYIAHLRLPRADHWLGQVLAIQTDQDRFLDIAYEYDTVYTEVLPGDIRGEIEVYW